MSRPRRATSQVNYLERAFTEDLEKALKATRRPRPKHPSPSLPLPEHLNFQPPGSGPAVPPTLAHPRLSADGTRLTSPGIVLEKDDYIYLLSEPPGEPYYIGRIMGFVEPRRGTLQFLINWTYRPKDVSRHLADSRLLYVTMHLDTCPVATFRGKVSVRHKDEVGDLDAYRRQPNCFYFNKLYDRYMLKLYDVFCVERLKDRLGEAYGAALHKRFPYVFAEASGRGELQIVTMMEARCDVCDLWGEPEGAHGLVECAECGRGYHMYCLDPPLTKRPSRGFGWSCGCVERGDDGGVEVTEAPTEAVARRFLEHDKDNSLEERRAKELWPFHYLGLHANLADVVSVEHMGMDNPYPRSKSRLSTTKHQAQVGEWQGVQPYSPGARGEDDTAVLMWKSPLGETPPTGAGRGDWTNPTDPTEAFLLQCSPTAAALSLSPTLPNFVDAALRAYMESGFSPAKALTHVAALTRESLREPTFSTEEVAQFEAGVAAHGSELHLVAQEVPSQTPAAVVRFYYMWKKTPSGRRIWGGFSGRKKARAKSEPTRDALADSGDELAFEESASKARDFVCVHCSTSTSLQWFRAPQPNTKAPDTGRVSALCKRCARLWRRYGVVWESPQVVVKRVTRMQEWELVADAHAILGKQPKGKSDKGKEEKGKVEKGKTEKSRVEKAKVERPKRAKKEAAAEPAKRARTTKAVPEKPKSEPKSEARTEPKLRAKPKPKPRAKAIKRETPPPSPPPAVMVTISTPKKSKPQAPAAAVSVAPPTPPSPYTLAREALERPPVSPTLPPTKYPSLPLFDPLARPCLVCRSTKDSDEMVVCCNCGLNVHGACYGVTTTAPKPHANFRWFCDVCCNDMNPVVSTYYLCGMCYAREIDHDAALSGAPSATPDALKRTTDGGWCHVVCALFAPHVRFEAPLMQPVQGVAGELVRGLRALCSLCLGRGGVIILCSRCEPGQGPQCIPGVGPMRDMWHPHTILGTHLAALGVATQLVTTMHVTCAQDLQNHFLGFELDTAETDRSLCVQIALSANDTITGRPFLLFVCLKHLSQVGHSIMIFPLRTRACRLVRNASPEPLMQLYIQQQMMAGSGSRAKEYLRVLQLASGVESGGMVREEPVTRAAAKGCLDCLVGYLPKWWEVEGGEVCQGCMVKRTGEEGEDLLGGRVERFLGVMRQGVELDVYRLRSGRERKDLEESAGMTEPETGTAEPETGTAEPEALCHDPPQTDDPNTATPNGAGDLSETKPTTEADAVP